MCHLGIRCSCLLCCWRPIGSISLMRFSCLFVSKKKKETLNNDVVSQRFIVLIVLAVGQNNEYNRTCDITALFGVFLVTNKHQNPISLRCPYCCCVETSVEHTCNMVRLQRGNFSQLTCNMVKWQIPGETRCALNLPNMNSMKFVIPLHFIS